MKKIGTHDGIFHADEVFAVMMLKNFIDEYKDAEIIRTRDEEVLKSLDIVVDVGGVYDPQTLRFDHHQRTFEDTFSPEFKTRLSSCGLIYRHFAKRIIAGALQEALSGETIPTTAEKDAIESDEFVVNVYRGFIENIDAVDNGISAYPKEITPRYMYSSTDIFSRISRLNGSWWKTLHTTPQERFELAMAVAKTEFLEYIANAYFGSYHAIPQIESAIEQAAIYDEEKRIIYLPIQMPWKEALFKVESKLNAMGRTRFVIYKDSLARGFRVQAVPEALGGFALRTQLKPEWCGLRDKELIELSGISDAIFCHVNGFIGGALSMESCIQMAKLSLQ